MTDEEREKIAEVVREAIEELDLGEEMIDKFRDRIEEEPEWAVCLDRKVDEVSAKLDIVLSILNEMAERE
jgi:hypothetical protein